jgi:IPT/TIG domain
LTSHFIRNCHRIYTTPKKRIFNITIENTLYGNVDIVAIAGAGNRAVTIGGTMVVDDGALSISVAKSVDLPKINGIEIKRSVPHIAHSVSNGPYHAVDSTNIGSATVNVDGSESHTHGIDLVLNQWKWTKGNQVLATGEVASFSLPVGTHDITLTVIDSGGNEASDTTTVTVDRFGFPYIATLSPSSGGIAGGQVVTITGSGFTYPASQTIVHFGIEQFTGSEIQIVSSTTITVVSPLVPIVVPVQVKVETPLGTSDGATFMYTSSTAIAFSMIKLLDFAEPTTAEFGPDGKLYVGTLKGTLGKITLNADFTAVTSMVTAVVQPDRAILGITFDPIDAGSLNPPVYISSSLLFHGGKLSSSGSTINGKISQISGANLDIVTDIVTGLPVCDNDHGTLIPSDSLRRNCYPFQLTCCLSTAVNQIEFGNNGKIYINIGSNTNGGVPGKLSGSGQLKENYFSAATIEADVKNPLFDGFIEYSAPDDGSPINYVGVSVFAPGQRNPFGLVLHSNGYLYATDNGPNTGYGK